jgi:hypothetical protein
VGPGAHYHWVDVVLDPVDDSGAQCLGRKMHPADVHITVSLVNESAHRPRIEGPLETGELRQRSCPV